MKVAVNGEARQDTSVADLVFDVSPFSLYWISASLKLTFADGESGLLPLTRYDTPTRDGDYDRNAWWCRMQWT